MKRTNLYHRTIHSMIHKTMIYIIDMADKQRNMWDADNSFNISEITSIFKIQFYMKYYDNEQRSILSLHYKIGNKELGIFGPLDIPEVGSGAQEE